MSQDPAAANADDDLRPTQSAAAPALPAPRRLIDPTPILISPLARNLWIVVALVLLFLLFRAVPAIVTISLGGAFLALILSFPVNLLSHVMRRGLAILVVLLSLIFGLVTGLAIGIPLLVAQLEELITSVPALATQSEGLLRDVIAPLQERGLVSQDADAIIEDVRNGAIAGAQDIANELLNNLLTAIGGVIGTAITLFAIVFVATYLLIDFRRLKAAYIRAAPVAYRTDVLELWDGFGSSLSRYLGGLLVSLAVQGILSGLALWALGVPYAFLLGLWVSVTAVIPYLGAFIGAIPAVLLGFIESPTTGIAVIVLYVLIQQLESNVLTPRIQGQAVRVHPILVLLTVVAANELAGLRGAIFAVPALAVARVVFDFLVARIQVAGPDTPVIAIRTLDDGDDIGRVRPGTIEPAINNPPTDPSLDTGEEAGDRPATRPVAG
jgi:predicted PurR-regulated permease PerM